MNRSREYEKHQKRVENERPVYGPDESNEPINWGAFWACMFIVLVIIYAFSPY
jgi:hypothetical protein